MVMKKIYIIVLAAITLCSCHESIEERAAREMAEFTRKNCPAPVSEGIVNDSVVFEKSTLTVNYYYSLTGRLDTAAINKDQIHEELKKLVQDAPSLRAYKDAGFNFSYIYHSTKNKGKVLVEITIRPEDYKKK